MDIPGSPSALQSLQRLAVTEATKAVSPVSAESPPETAPVVKATVIDAETLPASGQTAARTLLTVTINAQQGSAALPEFSALDDAALALAREGKPFSLQLKSDLAIPKGAELVMKLDARGAQLLDGRAGSQLPVDVRQVLSQALVRQASPLALLQQLMALTPDGLRNKSPDSTRSKSPDTPHGKTTNNARGNTASTSVDGSAGSRPGGASARVGPQVHSSLTSQRATETTGTALQGLVGKLQDLVPDLDEVLEGPGIQRFLRQSGLFFEADLARRIGSGSNSMPSLNLLSSASSGSIDEPVGEDFKSLLLALEKILGEEISTPTGKKTAQPDGLAAFLRGRMAEDGANTAKAAAAGDPAADKNTSPDKNATSGKNTAPDNSAIPGKNAAPDKPAPPGESDLRQSQRTPSREHATDRQTPHPALRQEPKDHSTRVTLTTPAAGSSNGGTPSAPAAGQSPHEQSESSTRPAQGTGSAPSTVDMPANEGRKESINSTGSGAESNVPDTDVLADEQPFRGAASAERAQVRPTVDGKLSAPTEESAPDTARQTPQRTPERTAAASPAPLPQRGASGLALNQYQSVQKIVLPRAASTESSLRATPSQPMPVPGLELPLPLQAPIRRPAARSREEAVSDLLQQTKDTLARTTLHQLASTGALAEDGATPKQVISFDLPVMVNGHVQVFNTRIEHQELPDSGGEGSSPEEKRKEKLWTVSLGFDIEGLGPMFCQLSLVTRDARLQIWSENPTTHQLAETHRELLEKSMSNIGVNLKEVACHNGMPKQVKTQLTQTLVDITT